MCRCDETQKVKPSSYELSIVIPLYNEEDNVPKLINKINSLRSTLPKKSELIFVNDGSSDATLAALHKCGLMLDHQVLSLTRNFGHQAALLAGLKHSRGELIVTMDGDLQHPIELISRFIELHKLGFEIIHTRRKDDVHFSIKSLFSKAFYLIINRISQVPIPVSSSDFRSITRKVLEDLLQFQEHRLFLRGIVPWLGYSSTTVEYYPEARASGSSKYVLGKMLRLAVDGLVSFTSAPLYLAAFASIVFFFSAFLYSCYVIYVWLYIDKAVSGWTSVILVLLTLSGFISLFLGLIGVYISAIYDEVKKRPKYLVREHSLHPLIDDLT